ncbi:MAG: hypothetical protein KF760_03060 [Candidatus Eremiobacteraeota bacterium]|nr:hypothetical protein [Candidatus Eremiobacteraeota bacterium]MCW5872660.1 hypothetical protein [Candidatus Eremiobacteraeota bacterium]
MTPDLIEMIEEGAALVRQGHFTLAVEKAQEKLKKFQLPDPRYYITQLVQALLANQALHIQVLIEGMNVKIEFDGPGYSREELERISDAVFESGKNRQRDRIRELALGLLSVQALNPRDVSISSQGTRWERGPGCGKISEAEHERNEIIIQHRRGDTQEQQTLRQTCQSCRADIYVNETIASCRTSVRNTGCPWPNYAFQGDGFRGAFGIAYGEITATHLTLTRYGVVFSKRPEARILPSLIVEMEHDRLRKNASQSDVVEDENYSSMLAELQKIQLEFALELAGKRLPGYQAQQVFHYFQELVVQNLSSELLALAEHHLSPLEARLCNAQMFQSSDGKRCSARQIWSVIQEFGVAFYTDDHHRLFACDPGSCIRLSDSGANSLRTLFPELQKIQRLDASTLQNSLQRHKWERSQRLPPALAMRIAASERGQLEFRIPDASPEGQVDLYIRAQNSEAERVRLGKSPLSFAIVSEQRFTLKPDALKRLLQDYVEPCYRELGQRLTNQAGEIVSLRSLQRSFLHYLEYRHGSLVKAFSQPEWQSLSLFHSVQSAEVRLQDLRAWLEVYPSLVVSYGSALSQEDHALAVTPKLLEALSEVLGHEKFVLADLSQPFLLERGQQLGLSGAARVGVKKAESFDEDAELAAIQREIELAEQDGLMAAEVKPLDQDAVLRQLGIHIHTPQPESQPSLSEFVRACNEASQVLNQRWQVAFQQEGLHGLVFVHDGALPKPLQGDRLLVKLGEQDPVAYCLDLAGVGGWLEVPAGWQARPQFVFPLLRSDSELTNADECWPEPELPFQLQAELQTDLVWALRFLFKIAAQKLAGAGYLEIGSAWARRFAQFLLRDPWASACEESCFLRVPLVHNLAGQVVDFHSLRQSDQPLFWAPLGAGKVARPYQTLRLNPPFEVADLEKLIRKPLQPAILEVEEKKEEQLLSEIKQFLVQTCQRSQSPLQPEWVEGLRFGEPTRWFGGPRKYFIKHEADEATTRLNPADAIFIRLFREQKGWEHRVPVLASAVYTAINRALDDVNDEHELAYLEAMLAQL